MNEFQRSADHKRERGLGLIEVIITMAVFGVVITGMIKFMGDTAKMQKSMQAISTRNGRVHLGNAVLESNAPRIMALAVTPGSSAPLCQPLADCVKNPGSCQPLNSCAFYDFGNQQITGSESSPMRLDLNGGRCSTAGPKCPLEVIGYFRKSGSDLEVWTTVRQAAGVVIPDIPQIQGYNDSRPNPGNPGGAIKPLNTVKVPLTAIKVTCLPTERLVGFNANGQSDCRPLVESKDVLALAPDAPPPPKSLMCASDEYMKGITKEGVPICGQYPYVWQYNNTVMCFEGGGTPSANHCNTIIPALAPVKPPTVTAPISACISNPHGVVCDPQKLGNPFCYVKYGPWFYTTFPSPGNPNQYTANVDLVKTNTSLGSFVRSCSGGGNSNVNCSYGSPMASDVQTATVKVPLASGYMLRLMRCMRPVRAQGSTY